VLLFCSFILQSNSRNQFWNPLLFWKKDFYWQKSWCFKTHSTWSIVQSSSWQHLTNSFISDQDDSNSSPVTPHLNDLLTITFISQEQKVFTKNYKILSTIKSDLGSDLIDLFWFTLSLSYWEMNWNYLTYSLHQQDLFSKTSYLKFQPLNFEYSRSIYLLKN